MDVYAWVFELEPHTVCVEFANTLYCGGTLEAASSAMICSIV